MKKIFLFFSSIFFSTSLWALISLDPLLNKVTLQLHSEQWVTTTTALVNVGINAAVSGKGIETLRTELLNKLSQFSKSEWHIVSFERQLDKSGLESIQITAQARLPQGDLSNLRDKAKSMSKPGETFTIDNIQFTPSEDELRQANTSLRSNIYQQAKAEIDALNKTYPDQKYYLHQVEFLNLPVTPLAMNTMFMGKAGGMAPEPAPLSVGNKLDLQARVVIASMSDQVLQKFVRLTP